MKTYVITQPLKERQNYFRWFWEEMLGVHFWHYISLPFVCWCRWSPSSETQVRLILCPYFCCAYYLTNGLCWCNCKTTWWYSSPCKIYGIFLLRQSARDLTWTKRKVVSVVLPSMSPGIWTTHRIILLSLRVTCFSVNFDVFASRSVSIKALSW